MRKKFFFIATIFIFLCFPVLAWAKTPFFAYLTWQSNSIVPFFYQGKPLSSYGNEIKVAALVFDKEGKVISPKRMSFSWYLNNKPIESGKGKAKISFLDKRETNSPMKVDLVLRDRFGQKKKFSLSIPFSLPEIVIYPKGSLVVLNKIKQSDKKVVFTYQSFFFSQSKLEDLESYWLLGENLIAQDKKEVSFIPKRPFTSLYLFLRNRYDKIGRRYYSNNEVKIVRD